MIYHYLDASAWVKRYSNQIRQYIQADWLNFIQIQLVEPVMQEATQLTSQLALRGADAIHLAAAKTFQNQMNALDTLIFITADQELKTAAQMIGMSVIDPEAEDRQIISP